MLLFFSYYFNYFFKIFFCLFSKKDCEILPEVIVNIQILLQDRTPQVQKRVVQCVTQLYRIVLMWLARAPSVTENMQKVWSVTTNMKGFIINMVDSENDG